MRPVVQLAHKTRAIDGVAPHAVPYDELIAAEQPVMGSGQEQGVVQPVVGDLVAVAAGQSDDQPVGA